MILSRLGKEQSMETLIDCLNSICPKKRISTYVQKQLDLIAKELNERQKTLNFLSPTEKI